ncbi:hypothetical protein T440DRAFT_173799 [Plenodomus tracheiphilus IPT5]|uniref:Uncharacterized protein n=1 Tax=Plenodomus tracheiphilus IPT5 TaxID=1408161 RepID=A0A6A7B1L2_9PLEO|nr:hypothetical protein T440DRAFT_173799 [Plenodomus tracheiphilus IPT5]
MIASPASFGGKIWVLVDAEDFSFTLEVRGAGPDCFLPAPLLWTEFDVRGVFFGAEGLEQGRVWNKDDFECPG